MASLDLQHLEYGLIYVCGNPKQTSNLRWFATMIEPMIRPLSLEWVETWDLDHTLIVARRFNVANMGKYATVQLHLNKYGRSDSFSLLAAVHAFSDCLEDVMDDSEGDVIIYESDFNDRTRLPHGRWGTSLTSAPLGDVLNDFQYNEMRQDNTRVELPYHLDYEQACQNLELSKAQEAEMADKLEMPQKESKKKPSFKERIKKLRHKKSKEEQILADEGDVGTEEQIVDFNTLPTKLPDYYDSDEELLDLEAEEVQEFERIEAEYERDVKDLRARIVAFITKYHKDPQQVITTLLEGKVLLGSTPGRLLVNGDMKIVLPEYDELEIEMPAMCRTLYILFMKQRLQGGGIVLKNLDEYRDEIRDIYGLVKPGASEERVMSSIDNLCVPNSESLNQTISRINRCIKNVITDKELAKAYTITGERGEAYGITLAPEFLSLPRAVTGA